VGCLRQHAPPDSPRKGQKNFAWWRIHPLACALLDTGCRVQELLDARVQDFDMDDLLVTVVGKGDKQRRIPFSVDLRRILFRYLQQRERFGVPGGSRSCSPRMAVARGTSGMRCGRSMTCRRSSGYLGWDFIGYVTPSPPNISGEEETSSGCLARLGIHRSPRRCATCTWSQTTFPTEHAKVSVLVPKLR